MRVSILLVLVSSLAVLAAGPHPRPALQRSRDTVLTRSKEAPCRKDLAAALSFETKDLILQKIVPLVGAAMANLMFLAPLSAVNEVVSSGSIGELNPIPMVAIVGNTMAWLGYSMTNGDPFVVLANGPGLLLGLHYVLSLLPAASSSTRQLMEKILLAYTTVIVVAGFAAAKGFGDSAQDVFGLVANALLLIFYSSPLSVLAKVIRTRSAESLYAPLSATSMVNGLMWTFYGLARDDIYVWAPNAFGAVLGALQLILCAIF